MGNQDCSGQTNMTPNQNSRGPNAGVVFAWVRSIVSTIADKEDPAMPTLWSGYLQQILKTVN